MKYKYIKAHLEAAQVYSKLSYCKRRQVGCVIVKNDTIIAIGYNGTPKGEDNCCEDKNNKTKPETIHAEDNALRKLIRSPNTAIDASLFVTTCPCIDCARKIVDAGINRVFYIEIYNNTDGLEYLKKHNIKVEQVNI